MGLEAKPCRKKSYAVGLEMSCPGGAYHWAPKIPSEQTIAGVPPGKCELVHNRGHILLQIGAGSGPCPHNA